MGASSTAAGMKKYKPRREPGSLNDMVYSESKKAAMDEAQAAKDTAAATAAYDKAVGKKKGGYVKAADGCATKGKTRGTMV
jgi:hypothetical protein